MLSNLKQAWKKKDVRRKILYTLMMIVIFRIGCTIPVPGVNRDIIRKWLTETVFFPCIICLQEELLV
ncbi:hypothetical protein L0P69_15880, partial [Faecalibacillus intestinalis]|nr:hypothetical protein [Faecalibacillus intestinalis]